MNAKNIMGKRIDIEKIEEGLKELVRRELIWLCDSLHNEKMPPQYKRNAKKKYDEVSRFVRNYIDTSQFDEIKERIEETYLLNMGIMNH